MPREPTTQDTSAATSRRRLLGVDAARGLALLGIVAVHVFPAADANEPASLVPIVAGDRSTVLFPVLAGVSLALATGGTERRPSSELTRFSLGLGMRALVIFGIGVILGGLGSGAAVILPYFALLFVAAIPFLWLRPATLFALAGLWALAAPIVSHALRLHLPPLSAETAPSPMDVVRELLLTGYYPVFPWMAYLLAGLGLGRLALSNAKVAVTLVGSGLVLAATTLSASWIILRHGGGLDRIMEAGLGAATASGPIDDSILTTSFFGTSPTTSWWWLTVAAPFSNTSLAILHASGAAAALLGLLMLAASRWPRLLWPLGAVGGMTLTLYSLHIVLLATMLPTGHDHAYALHVVVAFAVALPWRAFVGRGPLEALTERLARSVRDVPAKSPA